MASGGDPQQERAASVGTPAAPPAGRRGRKGGRDQAPNMLPGRQRRTLGLERLLVRLVATGGVIGVGVALGAILASSHVQGWIIGLVVAVVSVILSAILWSSRQL